MAIFLRYSPFPDTGNFHFLQQIRIDACIPECFIQCIVYNSRCTISYSEDDLAFPFRKN